MSVKADFTIENTHIKIDDEFVREEYAEVILAHIVTAAKPALTNLLEGSREAELGVASRC